MADKQQTQMTIGRVAAAAGVAATTLRFYERAGLLSPTDRSPAGYRLYDTHAVERLRFIRAAQTAGFTLGDIRELMLMNEETDCERACVIAKARLADVDAKLANLRSVRTALAQALERCRRRTQGCGVIAELKDESRREDAE